MGRYERYIYTKCCQDLYLVEVIGLVSQVHCSSDKTHDFILVERSINSILPVNFLDYLLQVTFSFKDAILPDGEISLQLRNQKFKNHSNN
jgi:hypothetical protein